MNKQLTKKTIGIAASAALMASVAFSGSALAGGGNNKKEQASIGVSAYCVIEDSNIAAGLMDVYVSIMDKSSGGAFGQFQLNPVQVTGVTKDRGPVWDDIEGAMASPDLYVPSYEEKVTLNVCGGDDDLGKAINAKVRVTLDLDENSTYQPSKSEYTAQCGDNPHTDEVEGGLKTADYEGLCGQ